MAEFQVRSDAVDVEQIMRQIRSRIREKRGADYTEQEIRELASVKLEKFLDPRGVRSNLVEEFRRNRVVSPEPKAIETGEIDIYGTHRGGLRAIRRLLNPLLKMLFNPTPLIHAINTVVTEQNAVNLEMHRRFRQREEMDPLYYEVIHNLVVELTRLSIENNNLKMRVESLSSRMDFDERRARALESVVQYKPAPRPGHIERPQGERAPSERPQAEKAQPDRPQTEKAQPEGPQGDRSSADPQRAGLEPRDQGERGERRRRRRRRRRPGQNMANGNVQGPGSSVQGQSGVQGPQGPESSVQGPELGGDYDGPDENGSDDGSLDDRATDQMAGSNSSMTQSNEPKAESNGPTAQSDSPIADNRSTNQIVSAPDNQIQDHQPPTSPEGSEE